MQGLVYNQRAEFRQNHAGNRLAVSRLRCRRPQVSPTLIPDTAAHSCVALSATFSARRVARQKARWLTLSSSISHASYGKLQAVGHHCPACGPNVSTPPCSQCQLRPNSRLAASWWDAHVSRPLRDEIGNQPQAIPQPYASRQVSGAMTVNVARRRSKGFGKTRQRRQDSSPLNGD